MRLRVRCHGQITVFLALCAGLLTSMILAEIEVARLQIIKADEKMAVMTACQSLLAEYSIPLFERYSLFAVDGSSHDLNAHLSDLMKANEGQGIFKSNTSGMAVVDKISITANQYGAMKKEIYQYMETAGLIEAAQSIWSQIVNSSVNRAGADKNQISQQIAISENQTTDLKNQYDQQEAEKENNGQVTEPVEPVPVTDPRKDLTLLLKRGLLSLVLPADFQLSNAVITGNYSFDGFVNRQMDFTSAMSVTQNIDSYQFNFDSFGDMSAEKLVLPLYIREKFKCAVGSQIKDETRLQYEMEYLACGHQNDSNNLLDVIGRIAMIRLIFNYMYLCSDVGKTTVAHSTAASIATALVIPWAEPIIYSLLVLAWAYAESIVDLRVLFQGGRVSMFKSAATWQVSLEHIGHIDQLGFGPKDGQGLNYMDYLTILIMLRGSSGIYERMSQLMETNVRLDPESQGFSMTNSYYSIGCACDFQISPLFYSLPIGQSSYSQSVLWSECY